MNVVEDNKFRKDKKRSIKRHKDQDKLKEVIIKLSHGEQLSEKYNDHKIQKVNLLKPRKLTRNFVSPSHL